MTFFILQDVEFFLSKLKNVRETLELPWNHLDFVFGKDADVKINDFIIRRMKKDAILEEKQKMGINTCQDFSTINKSDTCQKKI